MVMELVEVVKGEHTAMETAQAVYEFAKKIGKAPILLKKEIFGFVVNRILGAINREALYLVEQGVATPEEIDIGVTKGLGHPMGPFALMDLTGIDTSYLIGMERYRITGDPKDKPSPLVEEKYKKGEWGRKTGKGWYTYK
ncbi:MAG TPA: 3-hydroxyacyl-CoA dehydrogenase family protein [Firmicutes bacterium]|nr:3-hydroxyacyl-CoA dehydrogenase family protein [Bacillota bacterium]